MDEVIRTIFLLINLSVIQLISRYLVLNQSNTNTKNLILIFSSASDWEDKHLAKISL